MCGEQTTADRVIRVKPLHCFVLIAVVTRELSNYSRFRCERALLCCNLDDLNASTGEFVCID